MSSYICIFTTEKEYLPECIIDVEKPVDAPGNYLDCLTQEHFDNKDVDCCRYDNIVQCCNKGYGFDMYVTLETG